MFARDVNFRPSSIDSIIKEYWSFTKHIIAAGLFTTVFTRLNSISIGYFNEAALGLYYFASKLSVMALSVSHAVTTMVFAKISELINAKDMVRLNNFVADATRCLSIIVLGILVCYYAKLDYIFDRFVEKVCGSKGFDLLVCRAYLHSIPSPRFVGYILWAAEASTVISRIQIVSRSIGIICIVILIPLNL